MVVFSVLRTVVSGCKTVRAPLLQDALALAQRTNKAQGQRFMGHGRKLEMKPSRYEYTLYKDHLHFYVMLGLIPLGLVTIYANLFHSPVELAEIPEGTRPKHWEYFKSPVTRFLAKYMHDSPEKHYEKMLHYIKLEHEKANMRALEKKVKKLMAERGDYKAWYYLPVNERQVYVGHEYRERNKDEESING